MRADGVVFEAIAFGVSSQVEPMPGPTFSVARRGQEAIDLSLVRVRRTIREKSIHFFGRRWQSGQVEREAADELLSHGRPSGFEPGLFEANESKMVHRRLHPSRVANDQRFNRTKRLKGPMLCGARS